MSHRKKFHLFTLLVSTFSFLFRTPPRRLDVLDGWYSTEFSIRISPSTLFFFHTTQPQFPEGISRRGSSRIFQSSIEDCASKKIERKKLEAILFVYKERGIWNCWNVTLRNLLRSFVFAISKDLLPGENIFEFD